MCSFPSSALFLLLAAMPAVSCAAAERGTDTGPEAFIAEHYARLTGGADWEVLEEDFVPEAQIVRHDADNPGELIHTSVKEFFARMGPVIDGMQSFRIEPLGMRSLVYDRTASVTAYVQVTSVAADGAAGGFTAVDQFSLALGADGAWRITHLLYQREVDGWPPPRGMSEASFLEGESAPTRRIGFGLSVSN
ncbi:MAG TPA: hypothetical protein VGC54_11480 [Planctomycetota bacterium]